MSDSLTRGWALCFTDTMDILEYFNNNPLGLSVVHACVDSTRVQICKVRIPRSPRTGDRRSTHSDTLSIHIYIVIISHFTTMVVGTPQYDGSLHVSLCATVL